MPNVLIVDDEEPLLRNLSGYLRSLGSEFAARTATSAELALTELAAHRFEVLLTDVRLPGLDGIELLSRALEIQPHLRVVVMTAFATPDLRDLALHRGAIRFLEKPLDLGELRDLLVHLTGERGWTGVVGDLELFDLLQLMVLTQRSRGLRVVLGDRQGVLVFRKGALVHASSSTREGEEAFFEIAGWNSGRFEELSAAQAESSPTNIDSSATHLMMEAARRQDEAAREAKQSEASHVSTTEKPRSGVPTTGSRAAPTREEYHMAIKEHLEKFTTIEGFRGVGVFTSQGEILESLVQGSKIDINAIGMYANNALLNAQKATDQMGVGRGNLMQIRAPKANVMMRCLNEATDFAATKSGKAHFHTVVVMDPEGNAAMAKMVLDNIVESIAEELR